MATAGAKPLDCKLARVGYLKLEDDSCDYPEYTGLVVLPGDMLMVVDSDAYNTNAFKLRLCSCHDGKLLATSERLQVQPHDVCVFDESETQVAMTRLDGKIEILSFRYTARSAAIEQVRILDATAIFEYCHGVRALKSRKQLVVSGGKKDKNTQVNWICWGILSNNDGHIHAVHKICKSGGGCYASSSYLATSADDRMVFISCWTGAHYPDNNGVYAFDIMNSKQKFVYHHKDLTTPKGISVDREGFIYVCNLDPSSIHQLTVRGEPLTIHKVGMPPEPLAMYWKESQNQLYVTSRCSKEVWRYNRMLNDQQEDYTAPEVLVSVKRKQSVAEKTSTGIEHRVVDKLQSDVETEMHPSVPVPEVSEDKQNAIYAKDKNPELHDKKDDILQEIEQSNIIAKVDKGESNVQMEMPPSGSSPVDSEGEKKEGLIRWLMRSLGLGRSQKKLAKQHSQGEQTVPEVLVSDERTQPVTEKTSTFKEQGVVDQGQSSVATEMPPSGPVPDDSEDDKQDPAIPVEILHMDDKSLQLYKKALRDGKEKIYNIRVMVVGQFGVGKTTLTKRLLEKPVYITERKSTEGIDVYKHCCKISLDTGEWIVQHEDSDQLSRLQRLMKLLSRPDQKSDVNQEEEGHREVVYERETAPEADNTQMSEAASSSRSDQEDQLTYSQPAKLSAIKMDAGHGVAHSDQETSNVTVTKGETESSNIEKKDAMIEILHLINENADKLDKDTIKYALLSIWDFAGQYAFYTTHQTFLTRRALYLLVIDLSQQITDLIKDDKCFLDMEGIKLCKVHDLVEIWMNSIHTCASSPEASIPHVILVGTHVDKLSEKYRKEIIDEYFKKLRYILKDKPTIHHLMDDIAIDNTQSDSMLETLKRKIFELASQQPHWGEERPARWLPLEQAIMTLKASGAKVVARSLIEEINMSGSVRIEDSDELDLFLIFHHEMGTILYFSVEGLREKIVLDPQWLIDALKSLITAEEFIRKYPAFTSRWYEFKETGRLTHELIDAIWTEKSNQEFRDNKDHILLLMEKLNIIARIRSFTEDGNIKESNYFLAPCILQQKAPAEVICPKPNDQMGSSSVLCFKFIGNFMPSPIFHRLLAACVAHWPIATKVKEEKQENQIFCGCCVFQLDSLHKLTLHFKEFIIFVRVTKMGIKDKTPSSRLCIEVREFINTNLLKIIGYLGQSLKFEYFIQCPEYNGESVNSPIPVSELKENAEVHCKFHDNVLESCNLLKFWFEDEELTGNGDAWMYRNLGLQDVTQVSQAGKMKADIDQTEAVFVHDQLVQCAKSVGIIRSPGTSGTGFRIGPNYIMTAKHVVDNIIQGAPVQLHQPVQLHPYHLLGNTNVFIDFSYLRDGVPSDENLKFYFEPEIVYANDELDTVILKLKPDSKAFPPPLTNFHKFTQLPMGRSGHLIGHSRADIKKTDKYNFVMLSEQDIIDRRRWSINNFQVDGYAGIEDKHRVLFNCSFEKGASGAPGFWICPNDGQAYVELMLLCGYPTWYYVGNLKDKIIPNSCLVEQGVSMKSIFDAMQESDESLCKTIFPRDNWDEEMAPME